MDPSAARGAPAATADPGDAPSSVPALLLVSVVALGVPAAQLALRALDDNRLTSWRWVFADAEPLRLFALFAVAIALANLAARAPFPPRRAAALLAALSFAAGACCWRAPEAVVDAARYFTQAKHLEVYGLRAFLSGWGRAPQAWTDLPLVPALYGVVLAAAGESRTAVQVFTTLLFSGTAVLTYRLGAALWDREVGFAGAALLLAAPYLLTQVPTLLVDVPAMFFLALALLAAVWAARRGGAGRLLLAAGAVVLALLAKYSAALLLAGLPAAALAAGDDRRRALRRIAAIVLVAAIVVAAALLLHRDAAAAQLRLLLGYQAPGLRRWGESFASTFLFQVHPFVAAGALASAVLALRRRDPRWLVVAWPVLVLLLLQVRRSRYWIPALPMLALLAGHGLQVLRDARVRRLAVACAVGWGLVVALAGQLPFLARTSASNLAAAGAYLDGLPEAAAEVFTPARPGAEVNPAVSVPILDLFTEKRLVHAYEPPAHLPADVATSPLRFTWEYRNPRFYEGGAASDAAVVVVSDDLVTPLPPGVQARVSGLRLERVFDADEGVFGHRTLVRVYRVASAAPRE